MFFYKYRRIRIAGPHFFWAEGPISRTFLNSLFFTGNPPPFLSLTVVFLIPGRYNKHKSQDICHAGFSDNRGELI